MKEGRGRRSLQSWLTCGKTLFALVLNRELGRKGTIRRKGRRLYCSSRIGSGEIGRSGWLLSGAEAVGGRMRLCEGGPTL